MATWTYSDWPSQGSDAANLARLNLHITEVSNKVTGPDVASDGTSVNRSTLQQYLTTLMGERARLEDQVQTQGVPNGGFGKYRIG